MVHCSHNTSAGRRKKEKSVDLGLFIDGLKMLVC